MPPRTRTNPPAPSSHPLPAPPIAAPPRPTFALSLSALSTLCLALTLLPTPAAIASDPSYDFSAVTTLAQGAVAGQNVNTPVPGFDLLLMKDGRVVYHAAFGLWWLNRLANADSATKTISGGVMLSLIDSAPRPITLDTRLSDFIPAFGGIRSTITIRQAFSHTSGLGNSIFLGSTTLTLQQVAQRIALVPLQFSPPNSAFSYGGSSMHAAGAVGELAGGAPWNTLFAQRISGPVGMTSTQFVLSSPTNPRIDGGCESNATDFALFMEMLRRGGTTITGTRVLSASSVSQMFTRQTAKPITILNTPVQSPYVDGADYGVGVWLDERDAQGNLLGALAAGARGFSSWIDFDDGMVGVFATDVSASGNVQALLYLLRTAAQTAIRNPIFIPCTLADLASNSSDTARNPNGSLGPEDLDAFIAGFIASNVAIADIASDSLDTTFNPNNSIGPEDLDAFIASFINGC